MQRMQQQNSLWVFAASRETSGGGAISHEMLAFTRSATISLSLGVQFAYKLSRHQFCITGLRHEARVSDNRL